MRPGTFTGWLWCGADFSSLEDRISALQTGDPNKLKVYTDGYDSHSLRAYAYFSDQMPDIDPSSVESINSIAVKYPKLRQKSKAPTFLLTFGGTFLACRKTAAFPRCRQYRLTSSFISYTPYRMRGLQSRSSLHNKTVTWNVRLGYG